MLIETGVLITLVSIPLGLVQVVGILVKIVSLYTIIFRYNISFNEYICNDRFHLEHLYVLDLYTEIL